MKAWISRTVAIALTAVALNASGGVLLGSPLDPSMGDIGFFDQKVCNLAGIPAPCPAGPLGLISGTTTITFDVINAVGIMNISLVTSQTPGASGFWEIAFEVFDPGLTSIAVGPPQVPIDFAIGPGVGYSIVVDWTFHSTGTGAGRATSASWTLTGTTGPKPRETPEPMTLALIGIGLLGLGAVRRRSSR